MLAIEPRCDDGGDEELGAVAINLSAELEGVTKQRILRVWSSVGHGQEEGLVVPELEVLVAELLAIDGLAAGALQGVS